MALLLGSLFQDLLLVTFSLLFLIIFHYYRSFQYWSKKGVRYVKPTFPFGNVKDQFFQKLGLGECIKEIYNELRKSGAKYGGFYIFSKPILLAVDPEFIKIVMTKNFNHFHDRGVFVDEKNDPLSAHLFAIEGQTWRTLRNKLSPTFTSGKMKMMFETLVSCGEELDKVLEEPVGKGEPLDIKDILARFTTDIIASCAFGLECNSLKNPDEPFRKQGIRIFDNGLRESLLNLFAMTMPQVLKFFKINMSKPDVVKFFFSVVSQTIEYREKNNIDRKDMMSLLIKLKNNQKLDDDYNNDNVKTDTENGKMEAGITLDQIVAQCFVFFVGGFETSSTTMSFALLELAQHQDIQDKLRKEIRIILSKHNGRLTYDALMEMPYLDNVLNETLRKYPPLPLLNRICGEDFEIPGTNTVIEKGTQVFISNYGLQMDPEYFPEPEKFDPGRFSDERKAKIPAYAYLPFGEGPRNCIGMRFGQMQSKVGLAMLLKNHKFVLHPKTKLPVEFDVYNVILSHKYGIWLQATRV